ncbi:ribonuclease E inhibitor RraB [Rhodopirellula sp. JC740]|uniref:Ribonuclease E inhibitor RraB n=1 Tax=Rhodopirellula halodulae TaxID=2894198 RepID=A0ABS8NB13_9BACT|nr:ribonuclease E inhibitor RraB [Rhodopirellula sp. JC740]MCC9640748.1 ribonuclease E inhibitor RraB [Rhodopirellula sp. JC740]
MNASPKQPHRSSEPDLAFDIDALFTHLVEDLEVDLSFPMDWTFTLRGDSLQQLKSIAETLEEHQCELQESVEEIDEKGRLSQGRPMLSVVKTGALVPSEVKKIADRMQTIAERTGVEYEGVEVFDSIEDDELFDWMSLDDAVWRMRHFSDSGLNPGEELPWVFLLMGDTLPQMQTFADALVEGGFGNSQADEEPDEDGRFGVFIFMDGSNDEERLVAAHKQIMAIATKHDAELEGIQFLSEEDFIDVSLD